MIIDYKLEIGICLFEQYFKEPLLYFSKEVKRFKLDWLGAVLIKHKYDLMLLSIDVISDKIIKREKLR